jgi:putative FmdB family regulatory protein
MPIYEYQCEKCKKIFDCITLRVNEKCKPKCAACGSTRVKKLVSRVRYVAGPREDTLTSQAEKRLMSTLGASVPEETRKEIKALAKTAAKRGKRRFESMMDTGKSENIEY